MDPTDVLHFADCGRFASGRVAPRGIADRGRFASRRVASLLGAAAD